MITNLQELIEESKEKRIPIENYIGMHFNTEQMEQIRLGLLDNLDVSLYANPIYNFR